MVVTERYIIQTTSGE